MSFTSVIRTDLVEILLPIQKKWFFNEDFSTLLYGTRKRDWSIVLKRQQLKVFSKFLPLSNTKENNLGKIELSHDATQYLASTT